MKRLNPRRLTSLLFLILSLLSMLNMVVSPVFADAPSPQEIKALNEYPNWVSDICATSSGDGTATDSPAAGGTPSDNPSSSTTMYDSADPAKIPSDAKVVASYVGDQQGYQIAKQKFPNATLVSINETPGNDEAADIWGIEPGSGKTVQGTAAAIASGKVHGVYGSQSDLDAVKNILNSKNVARSSYVLWLWMSGTQGESSIPAGDDAKQYKYVAGQYDVSTISSTFLSTLQGTPASTASATSSSGDSKSCCSASPSVPVTNGRPSTLIGKNNVEKSFNYFIQAGFSPAQSAGIVGNLMQESGGGKTVDPHSSNGIAGFLVGEVSMAAMSKWVTSQGEDPNSLKGQLDFLLWYITKSQSSIGDAIKAAKSVDEATIAFQNDFEKCGSSCLQDQRIQYAHDVANGKYGGGSVTPDAGKSVDISDIVKRYNLQSAVIQKLGNGKNIIASHNPNKPPATPASTMKLIIADTALQSGLNLDKTVSVTHDVYYDGQNDLGKNSLTLREALTQMLTRSSNVGANVLMKAMGGVDGFTNKAHGYGYTNTDVKGYYDPSNDGKNSSTIGDEAAAMNHIFARDGADYGTAQDALKQAAQSDNYYSVDDIANKWAGTSEVAGNVGLFNVNGNQYIIGLYYNGDGINDQTAKNAIKKGSSDLANAISASSGSTGSAEACCPPSTGSDPTTLSGNDNTEKVYNFFVNTMGYTPAQAAGAAGSLYFESGGMNPKISNGGGSGAYGIAQWLGTRYTDLKNNAGSNYDTLEGQVSFMQHELKTDYASVNAQMKQTSSYQDAQKTWTLYYEGLKDYPDQWFFDKRNGFAQDILQKYGGDAGAAAASTSTGTGSSCEGAGGSSSSVQAAVKAAQQLSSYRIQYVWGGLHGANQLDITDPDKLRAEGADCSGSVSWVLHQAGMMGSTGEDSTGLESWGQAGKGQEMTVWANSKHAFIEFNVPGLGHYQLNTVNPGGDGAGPRFFKVDNNGSPGSSTAGFTPRHWKGT